MRLLVNLTVMMGIALVLGLGSAWMAIDSGLRFGRIIVGPWIASPDTGAAVNDPYLAASHARTGEIVLGLGEGVMFVATTDSGGNELDGDCTYLLSGDFPPARLWTLTLSDTAQKPVIADEFIPGFHNRGILRKADGSFEISVAPSVQPGNWLPSEKGGRFQLVARLYDTGLGASGVRLVQPKMPAIERLECSA